MIDFGIVRPGTTLRIPFHTFSSDDPSASMTITGLATTDIEVYKNGSTTQRSSDSGFALLDTDGIDFDGTTGVHAIEIDLSDNTDAGFFESGAQYKVVIASITLDAATINFIAATFRIGYIGSVIDTSIATLSTQTSFTLTNGPAEDDALNGMWCIIHDVASDVQIGMAVISDYTGSTKTVTLAAATTFTVAASDNISIFGPSPLQPSTAGRTIGVESDGDLTKVNTLDGHTAQTGDSYARLGAPAGVSVSADIAENQSDLNTALGYIDTEVAAILNDTGELQTDWVNGGRLDLLIDAIKAATDNLPDSGALTTLITHLTDIKGAGFSGATDSLEAIRDRGDSAWITGGGGGITQSLNVQSVIPNDLDLADTATVRIGLILVNALDDLPSTAEITPGTISIERKAIGGTSWSSVVTDGAMSEQAGMVYYDEVFDSGTGYAEGDSIRVTFKSVSITADANTYEICDSNGIMFQTSIRQTMRGTDSAALSSVCTEGRLSELDAGNLPADIDSLTTEIAKVPKSDGSASWNATALAAIESEANDALVSIHLDHLLAVDYDPASKPGVATALLNEVIENDGGVSRFTANALENAPDSTTGLSLAADQGAVTIGTVTTLTGHTAQTGDSYARLGAPAGASISADIAENQTDLDAIIGYIDTEIAAILTDTGTTLDGKIESILEALVYKQRITKSSGDVEIFDASDVSQGTVSAAYTEDSTYVDRLKLVV